MKRGPIELAGEGQLKSMSAKEWQRKSSEMKPECISLPVLSATNKEYVDIEEGSRSVSWIRRSALRRLHSGEKPNKGLEKWIEENVYKGKVDLTVTGWHV